MTTVAEVMTTGMTATGNGIDGEQRELGPAAALSLNAGSGAPLGIEVRHLRYFVAVADAGTFTQAAQRMDIAQPTLSQQVRRLEEMIGTRLLQRRREGVRLTAAGAVLLEESRTILFLIDQGMCRARQTAGLGQARLRVVIPAYLPETLAVGTASRLLSVAAAADVEVLWLEREIHADFSLISQRRADAGVGWLISAGDALPAPLDVMALAEFEPEVWIPASNPAAGCGTIGAGELVRMDVIHGPRSADPSVYDAWLAALRREDPRFEFTDPPFRNSLPITLSFAAFATAEGRPTAVLTQPLHATKSSSESVQPHEAARSYEMVPVRLQHHLLIATAGLVWNGDLPRPLQQVLLDTAMEIAV